jgi:hypothetical protein
MSGRTPAFPGSPGWEERQIARANLRAAAPDLLAACQHALEHYELDPELQHVLRAAIRKAGGE